MIREEIEKLRGYVFTEEELNEVIKPAVIASECKINSGNIELNENGFPNYIKVRELIDLNNKELLIEYIDVMYEKYYALTKTIRWMQPEYIEYLKKLDDYLNKTYFKQLLVCNNAEEQQIVKLKLLRKEKNEVTGSVIKSDLKEKLEKFVKDLQENIKKLRGD